MPAQRSTALAVSTPSSGSSSGMIGLSTENAPVMMNWMPTMTQSVRCHCTAAAPFASAAADFCIAPPCSSRITLPLQFPLFFKVLKK
jgi:hypothetical protein